MASFLSVQTVSDELGCQDHLSYEECHLALDRSDSRLAGPHALPTYGGLWRSGMPCECSGADIKRF